MSNYLSPFERWQLSKFDNIIPEHQEQEEFEFGNVGNREAREWMEKQVELNQD